MPKLTPEERVNAQLMSLYTAVMCSLAMQFRCVGGDHNIAAEELSEFAGRFVDMLELSDLPPLKTEVFREFMRFQVTEVIRTAANSVSRLSHPDE
jgi:hypothetical protein